MKKLALLLFMGLFVIGSSNEVFSQSRLEKKLDKAKAKSASKLVKQLNKDGWKLDTQSKTLEEAILEHKVAMEKDENNYEIIGRVSKATSRNVAHDRANHNAAVAYAQLAKKSVLRGVETSNVGSLGGEEFDNFAASYERLVAGAIEKEMKESFGIYKEDANGNKEYNVYYIVNEEKAAQIRLRAMQTAIEESKLAEEFSKSISDFVRERFEIEE
ncbi:MAG: hypothetical protein IKT08_06580 [Bacteroidales bacterium]|nr:hypothetical protein [Bacteroidales bacterium]